MHWINLTSEEQLVAIKESSKQKPQLIFKHSTRCSISAMALNRLERSNTPENVEFYLLDLIANRSLSASISESFKVHHQSPQILLIVNGECIFDESHGSISMDDILEQTSKN
jgi:bacillithiol system protein YtxJ